MTRGRLGGCLGLLSLALLYASIRWAHHWNPRADAVVAAWALSTVGALGLSVSSRRRSDAARALAKLGLWLAIVSLLALAVAGISSAADKPGRCLRRRLADHPGLA